jgi:hypothetical protein
VQFIVSFVTAPFHSYYRMSVYRLRRPLRFKHVGVNVRLRLTDIQSIRSVHRPFLRLTTTFYSSRYIQYHSDLALLDDNAGVYVVPSHGP